MLVSKQSCRVNYGFHDRYKTQNVTWVVSHFLTKVQLKNMWFNNVILTPWYCVLCHPSLFTCEKEKKKSPSKFIDSERPLLLTIHRWLRPSSVNVIDLVSPKDEITFRFSFLRSIHFIFPNQIGHWNVVEHTYIHLYHDNLNKIQKITTEIGILTKSTYH